MRRVLAAGLLLTLPLAGCLGGSREAAREESPYPPGWDEEAPERSELADRPFYTLDHSTTFLAKGTSYARYVVRVPQALDDVQVFFSTTNAYSTGRAPDVRDPDAYHFEFMQIRPLGREFVEAQADAVGHFTDHPQKGLFTLTYLYGKGANYEFLAPYQGDPSHWRIEPGYYDFIVATDEKLTVGINVRTADSPYWSTLYDPQELGVARGEALGFTGDLYQGFGGQMPDQDRTLRGIVRAAAGERYNYFAFADVWYETQMLAVGATATATVAVDGEETPHKLSLTTPGPAQDEAYAFALHFDGAGPAEVALEARAVFHEEASAQSSLLAMAMVFGVVLVPLETAADLPTGHAL